MEAYKVEIEVKPWEEGGYLVEVPALQGCWCIIKPGQRVSQAIDDVREVIEMAIAARKKMGQSVPLDLEAAITKKAGLKLSIAVNL